MSPVLPFTATDPRDSPAWVGFAVVGHSGNVKLRRMPQARISDDLLREYANNVLGAKRISKAYLETLRYILANQARAEYDRLGVELNIRTEVGTERTMRTIIDQMADAGLTYSKHVTTDDGKSFTVQVYRKRLDLLHESHPGAGEALSLSYRDHEHGTAPYTAPVNVSDSDIPY